MGVSQQVLGEGGRQKRMPEIIGAVFPVHTIHPIRVPGVPPSATPVLVCRLDRAVFQYDHVPVPRAEGVFCRGRVEIPQYRITETVLVKPGSKRKGSVQKVTHAVTSGLSGYEFRQS